MRSLKSVHFGGSGIHIEIEILKKENIKLWLRKGVIKPAKTPTKKKNKPQYKKDRI
jgi:hypothetical protein